MTQHHPPSRWVRTKRWLRRLTLGTAVCFLFYASFLLLGFIPVNGNYTPPPESNRVRIFIRSNEIHTDLVLPVVQEGSDTDWRTLFPPADFAANVTSAKYLAIGWGNRGFYVETPRWSDLKLKTLLGAVLPSESILHVEYIYDMTPGADTQEVWLTHEQYREIVSHITATVGELTDGGSARTVTPVTYGVTDRFYSATGHYHAFNTCNQWTGRGLKRAGVPVGIWTPIKGQVLCWLPR